MGSDRPFSTALLRNKMFLNPGFGAAAPYNASKNQEGDSPNFDEILLISVNVNRKLQVYNTYPPVS